GIQDKPLPLDFALLWHRRRHFIPLDGSKWASGQKNLQQATVLENARPVNECWFCRAKDTARGPGKPDTPASVPSRCGARASSGGGSSASTPAVEAHRRAGRGSRRRPRSAPARGAGRAARAQSRADRYFAKGPGVTMFTRSSVHWAARIVATRSSSGLVKSRAILAPG